jgi:hypothetical protein
MVEPPERKRSRHDATRKTLLRFQESASPRRFDLLTRQTGRRIGRRLTYGYQTRQRKAHALQNDFCPQVVPEQLVFVVSIFNPTSDSVWLPWWSFGVATPKVCRLLANLLNTKAIAIAKRASVSRPGCVGFPCGPWRTSST